jgi:hypothetical protein
MESEKPLSNFPTATTTTKYPQLWDTDSRGKSIPPFLEQREQPLVGCFVLLGDLVVAGFARPHLGEHLRVGDLRLPKLNLIPD